MRPPKSKSIEPPWYGPVCPVVWEGWRREASPYPDQFAKERVSGSRVHAKGEINVARKLTPIRLVAFFAELDQLPISTLQMGASPTLNFGFGRIASVGRTAGTNGIADVQGCREAAAMLNPWCVDQTHWFGSQAV
jgi:hypothetical protein